MCHCLFFKQVHVDGGFAVESAKHFEEGGWGRLSYGTDVYIYVCVLYFVHGYSCVMVDRIGILLFETMGVYSYIEI